MATIIPPAPKRTRLNKTAPETPLTPVQSVIVQFTDGQGTPLGPPVSLPSNTGKPGLELLANNLRGTEEDPVPFAFHVSVQPSTKDGEVTKLSIDQSIQVSLREHADLISSEDILTVTCEPEAIFRVREINRCSASLDGQCSQSQLFLTYD